MENVIKTATSISMPIEAMERLNSLAQEDFRDRSAEIVFLVTQEWERRQALKSPTTPSQRSKARIAQEA